MISADKKTLAVVLASDDKHAFALAACLLSFKEKSPRLFAKADIIVYHTDITEENRNILAELIPVTFKKFTLPFDPSRLQMLQRYSTLCMAKYECFAMLQEYQNVLWLDVDLLFKKECDNILNLNKHGIAMAHDDNIVASNFSGRIKGFNFKRQNYNTGVIVFNDKLPNAQELTQWCYMQTQSLAPKILWIDQAVLNLALQNFKLKISTLPRYFNAHPLLSPVAYKDAYILHAMGTNKFWNNLPSCAWRRYYKIWLAAGGAPMQVQLKKPLVVFIYILKLAAENIPGLWDIIKVSIKNKFKKLNDEALKRG